MDVAVQGLIAGISYGFLLFLIAIGLSFILGFMGIINLAHGAVFIVGGYVGITLAKATGNFMLGVLVGALASGVVGLVIERGFLRHLYKQYLEQVLVTFGFVIIIANAITWIFGPEYKAPFVPSLWAMSVAIGELSIPFYRFAIIIIGVVMCLGLWLLQEKTRIGAIIRAGMDNAEMVSGLGINLTPITIGAFFFGSFIAGFGAVVGAPLLGVIWAGYSSDILFMALAVSVVGGMGSIQGALAGALLLGIIDTFSKIYFLELAMFTIYAVMILVLLFRPSGLLGRKI